jgi:hypothetical protein
MAGPLRCVCHPNWELACDLATSRFKTAHEREAVLGQFAAKMAVPALTVPPPAREIVNKLR